MRTLCCLICAVVIAVVAPSCSSANHVVNVCEDACDRGVTCGTIPAGSVGSCKAQCGGDVNPFSKCSNESALVDCQDNCLAESTCASYESCLAACPVCGG